ncbi:hypothetical protein ACS0TY_001069 [Phlomoides rotata]
MKRVQIHQTNHPIDANTFEAFWNGSWQPVDHLNINNGAFTTHIVNNGLIIEEDVPMSHLRVRSRRAMPSDCISFLRQGVDVCVFSTPPYNPDDTDDEEEKNDEPGWIDGRIRSIDRKPHGAACDCSFFISLYIDQGPDLLSTSKKLSKETIMLKMDKITILQRLEWKTCEDQYYRWSTSEDSTSVQKFRLYTGRFCSDFSWLVATSVLKRAAFNIRSIKNHLVYEISEYNPEKCCEPGALRHTVNFKLENDIVTPFVVQVDLATLEEGPEGRELGFLASSYDPSELRRSKRRNVQPERYLACDDFKDYEIEVTRLGESKTFFLEYDESSSSEEEEFQDVPCVLSVQDDNEYKQEGGAEKWLKSFRRKSKHLGGDVEREKKKKTKHQPKQFGDKTDEGQQGELAIVPGETSHDNDSNANDFFNFKMPQQEEDESKEIGEMVSKYFYMNGFASSQKKNKGLDMMGGDSGSRKGPRFTRRKYNRVRSHSSSANMKRDCFYVRESIYDVRSFRKGSVTAQLCRELIRRCMNNIDSTLKNEPVQPPVLEQWREHQSAKFYDQKDEKEEKPSTENGEELSEIDMLWKEMELALASWYLLDESNEDSHMQPTEEEQKPKTWLKQCEHDFQLDEQVGTVCQLCGFVETKIKDILPPFAESTYTTPNKEQRTEDNEEQRKSDANDLDEFCIPAPSHIPPTIGQGEKNVWALIPELKDKLLDHQKKAFEFLWRNIAGSLIPARMEKKKKKRGGCVISHSPGAGKTLLIIAFLVSYLKLFPGSRPLVLAPKTTLYTWYKEIIKWKVPIPVYQIHGGQTYKGEVLKQRMKLAPGLPRNQDVMHVLDCLEKMQMWLSHPSILLMGYTSFLTLTREDSHYAHRKYMAQLLKQCPGIVILDEGHNPRSTKSRLRKALMKVNTRLRVLLSGTLFQNNFGEYFNTLCLARPIFVNEVLKELDPKYEKRNKQRATQFSLENRGRKLLIDKISKKIDSNKEGERAQALKTLRKLTTKFIDVHEGGSSNDRLPGLQVYTLMMKSTSLQQELLLKLQNQRPVYKGFPLELELLITLGAIHPWLIRTTACSRQYFSDEELGDLEKFKFDIKSGSKVRFVMSLVPGCLLRNEKLLIFCHNIAPINLFIQIFEKFYGWSKGREVLVLQGDIELFERGRVMDKFEEPGGPSKVMLASITACAEGISLTAASRVILLDSEWNPSKSKQAVARAFRPGQNKVVYVYQLLATGTLEEEKHSRTTWKEWVSDMIFSDEFVEDPSHWQAPKIEDELLREIVEEDRAALFHRIMKNEKASNVIRGKGMLKQM